MRNNFASKVRTPHSCWLAWLILGFGLPAVIAGVSWLATRFLLPVVPASIEMRFLASLSGPVVSEWIFVAVLWLFLRRRNRTFKELGVWRRGAAAAWAIALGGAGLSVASNLRYLPAMHIPIVNAFLPHGVHLVAAVLLGVTAGFCEEVMFRAFLMTEFARAGYGRVGQVILPGLAFGFSHLGYSIHGLLAVIGIMAPTALLGMLWGWAYLTGRRALVPCIAGHLLNDATALPWILYFLFGGNLG